jgi:hypothetical protein
MKITNEQYKSFNNEFKDLISKFFNIHVEDNTAFYAWYAKKRNEIINDVETYQFIQQFRKNNKEAA